MDFPKKYLTLLFLLASTATCASNPAPQIVIGNYTNGAQVLQPLILTENTLDHSWSFKKSITGIPENRDVFLSGINCTASLCLSVGQYWPADTSRDYQVAPLLLLSKDQGKSWNYVKDISGLPPSNRVVNIKANTVHCSGDLCVVAGDYTRAFDTNYPFFMVSKDKGQSWKYIDRINGPKLDGVTIDAIHCKNNSCTVVGSYGVGDYGPTLPLLLVSKDSGDSWSVEKNIAGLPRGLKTAGMYQLSCNDNVCVASGCIRDADIHYPLLLSSRNHGQSWTMSKDFKGLPEDFHDSALFATSCTNDICVAAGSQYNYEKNSSNPIILTSNDEGKSWSYVKNISNLPSGFQYGNFNAISCAGKICAAVGYTSYGDAYKNVPMIVVTNDAGKTWSYVPKISDLPADSINGMFSSVNCTETACTAVGGNLTGGTRAPIIVSSNHEANTWSLANKFSDLPVSQSYQLWSVISSIHTTGLTSIARKKLV